MAVKGGTRNSRKGPEELHTPQGLQTPVPQGPTEAPVHRIWGHCNSSKHILFCSSMQILSLLPI